MKRNDFIIFGVLIFNIVMAGQAFAHTPLCACHDNGDGTITCEGGFSDGSSASGVRMRVEKSAGGVLIKGKMDENSEYTFDKPDGDYKVVFDAGEGHILEIDDSEIFE
jgi:hypothetical protein